VARGEEGGEAVGPEALAEAPGHLPAPLPGGVVAAQRSLFDRVWCPIGRTGAHFPFAAPKGEDSERSIGPSCGPPSCHHPSCLPSFLPSCRASSGPPPAAFPSCALRRARAIRPGLPLAPYSANPVVETVEKRASAAESEISCLWQLLHERSHRHLPRKPRRRTRLAVKELRPPVTATVLRVNLMSGPPLMTAQRL